MATTDGDEGPDDLRVFAGNLARFREAEGFTQQELAGMAGVSVASVYRYEAAKGLPERAALRQFARIFGRQIEDFFNPDPPPAAAQERQFNVRFMTSGPKPPGFDEEMRRFLDKYKVSHAVAVAKRKAEEPMPRPAKRPRKR